MKDNKSDVGVRKGGEKKRSKRRKDDAAVRGGYITYYVCSQKGEKEKEEEWRNEDGPRPPVIGFPADCRQAVATNHSAYPEEEGRDYTAPRFPGRRSVCNMERRKKKYFFFSP